MPFVIFVAPLLSDNAFRMIDAVAGLPGVQPGVITHEEAGKLRHLQDRAAHWRVSNILDPNQLIWATRELGQRHGPVHRLFGAYEQAQEPLAVARQALGIEGLPVEAALNFRDKARMKTLLRDAGLPCARHRLATSLAEARDFGTSSGFPMVVKPPAGAGAVSTYRVESLEQLAGALKQNPPSVAQPVLLEEFVTGEEHSFETVSIGGKHVWHSLTHYYPTPLTVLENPWIQWALVLPREVDDTRYDDIRNAGRRALEVLGMTTGISHMEWFRRKDGSIAISEVAARPPGAQITTLMSKAHEFDLLTEWARAIIFGEFHVPERRYASGAAFLRGQGQGRIVKVHGIDDVQRAVGHLVVDVNMPQVGATPPRSCEGGG